MAAKFAKDMRTALERFDYSRAENLLVVIREAEAAGYELTKREENLWQRLVRCVEQYRRASWHAE
jgi:hypothetical protein